MARKPQESPTLDMTPMIDVVFELIIFFVVTIEQENIFSRLNVNRPAPASSSESSSDDITVEIQIGAARGKNPANGVIVYNKKQLGPGNPAQARSELDHNLAEIARVNKKTPIIIRCGTDSPHKALVDVLDYCYKNELYSVSVFTM